MTPGFHPGEDRFDPDTVYQVALVKSVKTLPSQGRITGSNPVRDTIGHAALPEGSSKVRECWPADVNLLQRSSMAERLPVKEMVVGSTPTVAALAGWQIGDVRGCNPRLARFDSGTSLHVVVAQLARAPRCQRGGREFESRLPHHVDEVLLVARAPSKPEEPVRVRSSTPRSDVGKLVKPPDFESGASGGSKPSVRAMPA